MRNHGAFPILGIMVHAVDYEAAVDRLVRAATRREPCAVSALAVHGVMTGWLDPEHARRLNGLDLVVPDGQPVRWALRWLHGQKLPDRVYGPELTLRAAEALAAAGQPVYLYGSTEEVLLRFAATLRRRFPGLRISGLEPSRFRRLTATERSALVGRIRASGARAVFVGLGCPRQEVWAFELRERLGMPILAVGAAFDFHAGTLPQAPRWMQDRGLEWLFRLAMEPRRLAGRYLLLNPRYLYHIARQRLVPGQYPVHLPDGQERVEAFG